MGDQTMDADFVERYLDAWNRHDADAVLGFMTHDCTYTDVAVGETYSGSAALREFVGGLAARFSSDYRFEGGFVVLSGDGYAAEWVMKGTHDGQGPRLPGTGKPYAIHGVSIGELRDGKIARNTDYWNMTELLVQVGLMPAPGRTAAP